MKRLAFPVVVLALTVLAGTGGAAGARPGDAGDLPDLTIGAPPRDPGVYTDAQLVRRAHAPAAELSNVPGPAGADHWFAAQRLFPYTSNVSIDVAYREAQAQAARTSAGTGIAAAWQALGPANIGGRVTDIVADPTRADTVYAGAATGGVWRSTNAGGTFTSVWPATLPPSVGAMAITSGGVLYAGTGEANPGGGSVTFPGNGIYRSTDGGASWAHRGLAGSERIGRIAVDPTNANRLFAAATGSLFVPGGVRGLYRSTDAGATWQLVLAGANATTGAVDVAIDRTNPNRVYAAMWDHIRRPEARTYGGVGSGIYRSTDGGTTWTRLGGGLPAASTNLGRMGVAVAPSNSNRVYVIAVNTTGNFAGFWTSTNGGSSFTRITNTSFLSSSQSTYGWWFGRIWVDPASSQRAWVAGVPMLETLDAGANWRRNTTFHVDQHGMAWDSRVSGRVYIGNDGGVYRSSSGGSLTGSWTKASSLPINQFYTVAVSRQDPARISAGAQDNGSLRSWGSTNWNAFGGGDGTTNLIDPTNHNKVYSCSQYGVCSRSTDGGSTNTGFTSATVSDRRNWLTPIVLDPANPAIMYYGGNRLNRSTNSAVSWTVISPDLSRGNGGTGGYPYGTITTIAASGPVIYAGTDDGRVWITRNTGGTWTEITAGLPTRWITRIAMHPTDVNTAYVTVSGYRNGDPGAHVFRTTNGGTSWVDISAGLPDAPVNDIVLDPRNPSILFVGTDVGVYSAPAGGAWTAVGTGLPLVPVADIDITPAGVLTAATFGLGVYRTTV